MEPTTTPLVTARVEVAISVQTLASIVLTAVIIFITFFAIRKVAGDI